MGGSGPVEDLKVITAGNIIDLRTKAGMTQLELAEKLNYSDKSVSKWERAEALPDAYVLKKLSEIFGVTVDYLLTSHDGWTPVVTSEDLRHRTKTITKIAIVGIWTLATLLFVIFWLLGDFHWIIFVYAIPVSLITLLVLNSIWEKGRYNYYIIAALIAGIITSIYLTFLEKNWWQIFILIIPAWIVVFLCSRLHKRKK